VDRVVENAYSCCTDYHFYMELWRKHSGTSKTGSRTDALVASLREEENRKRWEAHRGHFAPAHAKRIVEDWSALRDACRNAGKLIQPFNDLFIEVATEHWQSADSPGEGYCHSSICNIVGGVDSEFSFIIWEADEDATTQDLNNVWSRGVDKLATSLTALPAELFRDAFRTYRDKTSPWTAGNYLHLRAEYLRARRVVESFGYDLPKTLPAVEDTDEEYKDRLRQVIRELGPDAKPSSIIDAVKMNRQNALDLLRELQKAGEYSGFSKPRPARYRR